MTTTVQIGKRFVPVEHIALIEPFDPAAQPRMQSERPFQTRIVLLDRDSVLTEEALGDFAARLGFRTVSEDGVATNPAVHFNVEAFTPSEGFAPDKPYRTRLLWRDLDGGVRSKLLMTEPEKVLAIAVRGEIEAPSAGSVLVKTVRRNRRRAVPAPV